MADVGASGLSEAEARAVKALVVRGIPGGDRLNERALSGLFREAHYANGGQSKATKEKKAAEVKAAIEAARCATPEGHCETCKRKAESKFSAWNPRFCSRDCFQASSPAFMG